MLKDCLYVPGLMKSLFSWSKLKSHNQYYLNNYRDILVCKIVNDKVILGARECPCTHLCNISTRTLEAYTIYTFWYIALGYPSHDLMKYINVFSDGNLILFKLKNFGSDSYLESKFIYKVPKILQDHVKSIFEVIHSDVRVPLAISMLGGK
jgi:hypothetical protein